MPTAIGIDIGTSFCRVAVLSANGQPHLVGDEYGNQHIPAVVRYTMRGAEVGYYPERFLVTDWENSVRDVTRYIGRWSDLPPAVLTASPCTVYEEGGRAIFNVLYSTVRPEAVYAALVEHLVGMVRRETGEQVRDVVLTVPASAEDRYRVAVKQVVEQLGVRVLAVINQPTAALLAIQSPQQSASRTVAVVDVGGGNTDVSLARVAANSVTILSTAGYPYLGGVEMQQQLAEQINARLCQSSGLNLLDERGSRVRRLGLFHAAGEAMQALTTQASVPVVLDHISGFGQDVWLDVQRAEFEQSIAPTLERISATCTQAMQRARLAAQQVQQVILIGGASQIPAVQATIARAFNRRVEQLTRPEPLGAVACGAAIQAGILLGQVEGRVRDVTPYPLGIAAYPAARGLPDDETEMFSVVVERDTPIPTPAAGARGSLTRTYVTRFPNQTQMRLQVLQYRGSRACASNDDRTGILPHECEVLGEWTMTGITSRQRSDVEVTFQIDRDGILQMTAREQGTQNVLRQQIERW